MRGAPTTSISARNGRFNSHSSWVKRYRQGIRAGEQRCRNCTSPGGMHNPLTLDHLLPRARGGRPWKCNATILCQRCNVRKGDRVWPWLCSLTEEEHEAARVASVAEATS